MNTTILQDFDYFKAVNKVYFGKNKILKLENIIKNKKKKYSIIFIDKFFETKNELLKFKFDNTDHIFYLDTSTEPTTELVDKIIYDLKKTETSMPDLIVGIGGGSTLDTAKAVSNLLTNPGKAFEYQGWDLIKNKGIYKVGVPTLSGTGAEATRTCVLINNQNGLKLGMNSPHTVYDEVILDPTLTATVSKDQFFYSAMDTYIHSIESLNGVYRNILADNFSSQALRLSTEALSSSKILDDDSREKIMIASYLGGCAISLSYVGLIHPLSAALSVVFKTPHCLANCIVMRAMNKYYQKEFNIFWNLVEKNNIYIPKGICKNSDINEFKRLINSTIIHEKPLTNYFGENFRKHLTDDLLVDIFKQM